MSGLTRQVARIATRQASTHSHDSHAVWREINRLGSEGKWDSINNKPKLFLFGQSKKEASAAFNAINKSSDFFNQSAYGPYLKVVWRLALLLGIINAGVIAYDFVVPEQKRLHYKYRHHGHHDEHH
ncbi:unnamed protein product [Caenorhabditis angaria]|uniref:Uncharacterized protein n=1 Tax=Caenorhabditis angaria TaxID=860376 RepID=A0A9P1IZU8_9PELO|nr:unnamed protein product [Caenorhabditis angaria]